MSAEAFCYIGLRKHAEALPRLVELLAEPGRSEARAALEQAQKISESERQARLLESRELELSRLRARVAPITTAAPDGKRRPAEASPRLLEWILFRTHQEADGREDS